MSAKEQEKRRHYRGKPRTGRQVGVSYVTEGQLWTEPHSALTGNIGVGGAFILTAKPAPVGTRLVLRLDASTGRDKRVIEVHAEVRWNTTRGGRDRAGMGVKFVDLDVDSLLALSEYYTSLSAE